MRPISSGRISARATAFAVVAFLLLASVYPPSAPALPSNSKIDAARAQAADAQAKLDEFAADLEERSEEYLAIEDELARTRSDEALAAAELTEAEEEVSRAEANFNARVSAIYRNGRLDLLSVFVGVADFRDFVTRIDLYRRVGASDAAAVSQLKAAREQVARTRERLENRRTEQTVLLRSARRKKAEVEQALAAQRDFLKSIDEKLNALIAEERERQERLARERAAAAAAAAAQRAGGSTSGAAREFDPAALGQPHPEVVASAQRFVGKTPYVWGGTTPAGFDCSGLTQYCYREAGIDIPRTSRQQFRFGAYIPPDRLDLLQPGDLVFFGRDGDPGRVHHVGIYAGDGNFIHAPQTGMRVSVSSLLGRIETKRDYVGATRP